MCSYGGLNMRTKQTSWYLDIQKIIRGITIFICFIAALTLKNKEPFLLFDSRQPNMNDFLHDYVFHFFLDKVNLYVPKATFVLVIATILVLILSYIFDHYGSDMGYKLHICGMAMATLSGMLYILLHVCIGYGKLIMNVCAWIVLVLLLGAAFITVHSFIFFMKRKDEFEKESTSLTVTIFLIIAGCFIGYSAYLVKNLGKDYKACYETNQYLKVHPTDINEDAAYQIGNIVKLDALYLDGYIYYATGKNLSRIDSKGNVEIIYTLPNQSIFYTAAIQHYDSYLYMTCRDFNESRSNSIIQFSLEDGTVKEIYTNNVNYLYFSIIDGKLLYEYLYDVYCIDLDKSFDSADATLYDKDLDSLSLDREIWIQKYVYNYLDDVYWLYKDIQFIDGSGYYIFDRVAKEQGYEYKAPDKYSYNANCTLIMIDGKSGTDYIAEGVVDFNIFDETIYYVSETETGYDILSCDKDGENVSLITSIPVDFIYEEYGGYYANIVMGDGFMICTVTAAHDKFHRYFIDIETGDIKEIEL